MSVKTFSIAIVLLFLSGQILAAGAPGVDTNNNEQQEDGILDAIVGTVYQVGVTYAAHEMINDIETPEAQKRQIAKHVAQCFGETLGLMANHAAERAINRQRELAPIIGSLRDFAHQRSTTLNHLADIYGSITCNAINKTLSLCCLSPKSLREGEVATGFPTGLIALGQVEEVRTRYRLLIELFAERNGLDLSAVLYVTTCLSDLYEEDCIPEHIEAVCFLGLFPNMRELVFETNYFFNNQSKVAAQNYLENNYKRLKDSHGSLLGLSLRANGNDVWEDRDSCCSYLLEFLKKSLRRTHVNNNAKVH